MRKFGLYGVLISAVLSGSAASAEAQAPTDRLIARSNSIDTSVDGQLRTGAWTLAREADPDVFTVEVARGQRRDVCFISGPESLCRSIASGDQFDFDIVFEGFEYATRIATRPPAAVFDTAYQTENRGRTQILIPEVYELVNIAIAVTPTGLNAPNFVHKDGAYYAEVLAHFSSYASHPLIAAFEAEVQRDWVKYFRLKMNGYAFDFDSSGRIIPSAVYARTGFSGDPDNDLLPYLEQLQSFADETGFRGFYRDHRPLYEEQVAYYRDEIDVAGALTWLQNNFPAIKPYDSTKIIFSPLVAGMQSLTTFDSNGFTELQPHVNFPYPQSGDATLTPKGVALRRGAILFTEMNHGFSDPTSQALAQQITQIFSDRAFWATAGTSSDSYGSPQALFNEYMNWALVSLYYLDEAPAADRDILIRRLDPYMTDTRGFPQFAALNQFLVGLYANRASGTTLADLYPQILAWAAEHRRSAGSPT